MAIMEIGKEDLWLKGLVSTGLFSKLLNYMVIVAVQCFLAEDQVYDAGPEACTNEISQD